VATTGSGGGREAAGSVLPVVAVERLRARWPPPVGKVVAACQALASGSDLKWRMVRATVAGLLPSMMAARI
jgi:hypothetical protein